MLKKIILGIIIVGALGAIFGEHHTQPTLAAQPSATPEQVAATEAKERAFQRVVRTMQTIKNGARNPSSVEFEEVLASDDGVTVCATIRAQNGFGGMNIEHVTGMLTVVSTNKHDWNTHCAGKSLNDMTYARRAL